MTTWTAAVILVGGLAAVAQAGTVLADDFNDNDISDWSNRPIASNWVDIAGRGDDGLIPAVSGGQVLGTEFGYFHGRWMTKAIRAEGLEFTASFRAMTGVAWLGQTSFILADASWGGDMQRLVGYEFNVYGEVNREVWISRFNSTGSNPILARYVIGNAIFSFNDYVVSRDGTGAWSLTMNGTPLSPLSSTPDTAYTDFRYLALNMGTPDCRFDWVRLDAAAVPVPTSVTAGLPLLAGLLGVTLLRRRRVARMRDDLVTT